MLFKKNIVILSMFFGSQFGFMLYFVFLGFLLGPLDFCLIFLLFFVSFLLPLTLLPLLFWKSAPLLGFTLLFFTGEWVTGSPSVFIVLSSSLHCGYVLVVPSLRMSSCFCICFVQSFLVGVWISVLFFFVFCTLWFAWSFGSCDFAQTGLAAFLFSIKMTCESLFSWSPAFRSTLPLQLNTTWIGGLSQINLKI